MGNEQSMNIIKLARAAGCHDNGKEFRFIELRYLERFAALVRAAALEEAAGVCEEWGEATGVHLAAAIRELKEVKL